jgi:tRNA pseudouridine13 synthase
MAVERWTTPGLPGTGGTFVPSVEDFLVEELPLYEPAGEGEHLYIRFEKRGLATRDVLRRVQSTFGVAETDVGYAGLKDKHATTVQTISVRGVAEPDAARLDGDGVRVLWARRHRNKLRVGHLAGNRFELVVRGAPHDALQRATAILSLLAAGGVANFYGEQRFGVAGGNVAEGREALLRGGRGLPHWKAKFLLSALQSSLFNEVLVRRLAGGSFARVLTGDLLQKVESGGTFECADAAVDQPRYDSFEVSITGPIFGAEMRRPAGEPAALEASVLEAAALSLDDFSRVVKLAPGSRRPLRVKLVDAEAVEEGGALRVRFSLPAGAYATVVADELVKPV